MHRDHWSHQLQQLRSTQFVDDNPSLTHLLSFRALRCARLTIRAWHLGFRVSGSRDHYLSFSPSSFSVLPLVQIQRGENKSMNAELLRRAAAWNARNFTVFTLPLRGLYRRHIRTSSAHRCHSSQQTSVEPLSRRSLQFARPSPLPVDL